MPLAETSVLIAGAHGEKVSPQQKLCVRVRRRAYLLHKTNLVVKWKQVELNQIFFDPVQDFILKIKKVFNSFHSLLVKIRRSSVRKISDSHFFKGKRLICSEVVFG